MSTAEKLMVQIFERKKSIIDQVKHQILLFDQHLASKCLLDGIAPPPWLLSSSFSSLSSCPNAELNKEELISGLLLPHLPPRIPYSGSYSTLYNRPDATANRGDLPDSLYAEEHTSNEGFGAGHQLSVLSQFPVNDAGDASNCAQKPESSAAAIPQEQRDVRMSDVSPEPAQSLASIQRSKSRQRALELRSSARIVKSHLYDENNAGVSHLFDENNAGVSHLCDENNAGASHLCDENNTGVSASGTTGSKIAPLQDDHVDELQLVESVNINESPEVEEAKAGDFHTKKKEVNASSKGFVAADGLSDLHQFVVNDAGCESNNVLELTSPEVKRRARISDIDPGPLQSLARVQRSKSRQRALQLRTSTKSAKKICVENNISVYPSAINGSGIASVQSDQDHESEMIKTVDFYQGSCELEEAKLYDLQSKENDSNPYSGRITRSRSSGRQLSSMRESGHVSKITFIGKSSRDENNVSSSESSKQQIEENFKWTEKGGGLLTTGMHASPSLRDDDIVQSNVNQCPVDEREKVEQRMNAEYKLSLVGISSHQLEDDHKLELVNPVDSYYKSSVVEDTKVGDFQDKEKSSNIYSGRTTRSQSSSKQFSPMRESLHLSKSNYIGKSIGELCPKSSKQQIEENNWAENVGSLPTNAVSTSLSLREDDIVQSDVNQSPVGKMDHVEQHTTGEYKSSLVGISSLQLGDLHELELVKPVDIYYESPVVEEAKVSDFQGKGKGSNVYSGRITRSQSYNQQTSSTRDSSNVSKSSCIERSSCDYENAGSSQSRQHIRKKSILSEESSSCGAEGSQPQSKQRKVESQQNGSPSASASLKEGVEQSSASRSLVVEIDQRGDCHMIGASEPSPKLQVEGELCLQERDKSACTPFTFAQEESEVPLMLSLVDQAAGDSNECSDMEAGVADPSSVILDSSKWCTMGANEVLLDIVEKCGLENTEHLTCTGRGMPEAKSHLGENGIVSYCSAGSPQRQSMELTSADQAMPEFEGFIMQTDHEQACMEENISFDNLNLPKSTIERASVLEKLCKSACMHTPLSHSSTTYKLHRAPNLYQSVPNGLLESMDLKCNLSINDDTGNEFKTCIFNEELYHAFQGRSHSDCLPFSSAQSAWDIRKPVMSPVGKIRDRITSNSGSSEMRGSLNLELPCINEENENAEEVADVFQEGISSDVMPSTFKREPLADITKNSNVPASASEAEIFAARNSIESVKTEYSFTGTSNRVQQKLHGNSSKRRCTNRVRESVRSRFSKPKLSGKPSCTKGGLSLAKLESKRNNIVSNVTSFIPLVQQKQPAAIMTGKRDVKVKALEAAEAAKRLAEEKENERKMKKAALKLERARLEQENLKQMELQKKKKEEERKKKEAEIAARKRQREEEERKEKERKRKRVLETLKQQQENEKLRAKKENEVKRQTMDEQVNEVKLSKDETGKDNRKGKEMRDENLGKMLKVERKGTLPSTIDSRKESIVHEVCEVLADCRDNSKVMSNLDKATKDDIFCTNEIEEESYDISPYKGSDSEDEDEEDDVRNRKFIPSWASKNSLAMIVSSQQGVNPEMIFPPASFCSITEVLLPRKLQLK